MKFVAVDFETANSCLSSICQIGVVTFDAGSKTHSWMTLINPDDYFSGMNVAVHGIHEIHVKNAPKYPQVYERIAETLTGKVVVHHTAFDRIALDRVTEKYNLPQIRCSWLDTARVVRRAWPELARRGYGLSSVAEMLAIEFRHHDAEEDARAAGEILLRAIAHSGISLEDWQMRASAPTWSSNGRRIYEQEDHRREGNPAGPLAGETIVFTGSLAMPRREAADLAADAGCDVADSVTKVTTLLVVGDQDIRTLAAGHEKSSKHRKAEAMIEKGYAIRILGESDFQRLIVKLNPRQV